MITVISFIKYIYIPLNQQWGYIYGTCGQTWTAELQKAYSQPSKTNWKKTKQYGSKWIGRRVTDCSGLVRWACLQLGESVAHHSHYLYTDYCRKKGKLNNGLRADGTEPLAGSLVFLVNEQGRKHHVGVYVGNDVVIEAKGTQYGVVTSNLAHWDAWGELKCINYSGQEQPQEEIINKPTAITTNPGSYLNLRAQPKKASQSLAQIPRGATVTIINQDNPEWWKIEYKGKVGYAASQYLKENKRETI